MAITGAEPPLVGMDVVRELEEAFLATWPAIDTRILAGWHLRAAEGVTGRSNSVTILGAPDADQDEAALDEAVLDEAVLAARLDAAESFYRARGLGCTVRVTPLTPPGLVALLSARGYRVEDESRVLLGALPPARLTLDDARKQGWVIESEAGERFFSAADGTGSRTSGHRKVLEAMLARAHGAKAFISRHDEVGPLAGAHVGMHGACLTLNNVASAPRARRQGLASTMMAIAAAFGAQHGASRLFLFVAADNKPAIALYRQFGCEQAYTYAYWRKDLAP